MDDLMNKIQSVLSDEESMNQIKELASMLSSEMGGQAEADTDRPSNQTSATNGMDFSKLLQGLSGGGGTNQSSSSSSDGFDFTKLLQVQDVLSKAKKPDKNIDMLMALRPLLKEENQIKVDRLVKIFKLLAIYPVLKESGLLGGDLLGLL